MSAWLAGVWRSHRPVVYLSGLACVSEIIYLLAFLWPFPLLPHYTVDTDMATITHHSVGGLVAFVVSFSVLFGLMAVAASLSTGRNGVGDARVPLSAILIPGLIFVATLVFVYPVTAIDLFNYVAESRLLVHYGRNPIFITPSTYPHDPIMLLSGGWFGSGAPYGPVGLLADAWPAVVVGGNLLWNLLLLKGFFGSLVVIEAAIVYRILARVNSRMALSGALLVAWNPLLLFEFAANGHNDIVMLVLASLGLLALVEDHPVTGLILVGLSAMVKYATLPLLPMAVVFVVTRPVPWGNRVRGVVVGSWGIMILGVLTYAPFWDGPATFSRTLLENSFGLQSFGAAVPVLLPVISSGTATFIGRCLFVPVYLYACNLAARRPADFLKGCCIAMIGFLALAAGNVKIWYLSWTAALSGLTTGWFRLGVALMTLGATLSAAAYAYVLFWLGDSNFNSVNAAAYLMAFAPAVIILSPSCRRGFALLRARLTRAILSSSASEAGS